MKRYLIAGLLVWAPLGITIWVLHFLVTTLDQTLGLLPDAWQPDRLLRFHVPGLGVLLSFVILRVTGVFAANFLGARLSTVTPTGTATPRAASMAFTSGSGTTLAPGGRVIVRPG